MLQQKLQQSDNTSIYILISRKEQNVLDLGRNMLLKTDIKICYRKQI